MAVNQVAAVAGKALKESVRDRMVLFWTYAVPLFFLVVLPLIYSGVTKELIPSLKGGLTLTTITLILMTAGQVNLPGSIATDRERGLYLKMASMPVSHWKEGMGRILAVWIFSLIGAALMLVSGALYGAKYNLGLFEVLAAMGFGFLTALTSVGVGMIIASFVKGESAATHTGVAITLLTYSMGGMALPYSNLPAALKAFARLYPISSANASMVYLLEGEAFVGYNPLNMPQTILTISLCLLIFFLGMILYSKFCWRRS